MNSRFRNSIFFRLLIICISVISLLIAEEWTISDSFETGNFDGIPDSIIWVQDGNLDWIIDDSNASDGIYSARSGPILDNQTSSIAVDVEINTIPGSIKFSYKTSTEAGYDKLRFYIGGNMEMQWHGVHEWTDATFELPPGSYTLKWEYYKDGSCTCTSDCNQTLENQDSCDDAVWIDDIVITRQNIVIDAGLNIDTLLIHDGIPGAILQLDGSNTYPDVGWFQNLMKWYVAGDPANILDTGPYADISLDCAMSDEIPNMCIGEHEIVLEVSFGAFSEKDTVHILITEPNEPPILTVNSSVVNSYIPNYDGIPGQDTEVNLAIEFIYSGAVSYSDPDDTESFLEKIWSDNVGVTISALQQDVNAGDYTFGFVVRDPYGSSTDNISLNLIMIEENEIPAVSISAINESDTLQSQNAIENQEVLLFGFVDDEDNDVDGSTPDTTDDVSYLWLCTQNGNSIVIENETSINASFTAPLVSTNLETEVVNCTLQATDPFQVIDETSSISESIIITIYNDNQPPTIDISDMLKPTLNEESSLEIILSELISNNYIVVSDSDEVNITVPPGAPSFTIEVDSGDNYILDDLIIIPNLDFYGEITVPIRISDGFIFSGELYNNLSETDSLIMVVVGINDPPVLDGPSNAETFEEIDIEIIGVTISDPDMEGIYPSARFLFNLNAENGTISLNSTQGLEFVDGCNCDGQNDTSMVFTANSQTFTNAVDMLTFHPSPNYFGQDGRIVIIVDDQGNIGPEGIYPPNPIGLTDTLSISIIIDEINDAPIINVPENQITINEDESISINEIFITDVDIADALMSLDFIIENGFITLSSSVGIEPIIGDGISGNNLSVEGDSLSLSNAISNMTITPDLHYNGSVGAYIVINDCYEGCDSEFALKDTSQFTIEVLAINDPPQIFLIDDSQSGNEGNTLEIIALSIADPDASESSDSVRVDIECGTGLISLNTIDELSFITAGDGALNSQLIFSGKIDDINVALNTLEYFGGVNFYGDDLVTIIVNDLGNSGDGGELQVEEYLTITIEPENDPPVNETSSGSESPPQIEVTDGGATLTASSGNWNDDLDTEFADENWISEITYEYEWQRADDENGSNLQENLSTSQSYILTGLDSQKYLRVKVTASDNGFPEDQVEENVAYSEYHYINNSAPYTNVDIVLSEILNEDNEFDTGLSVLHYYEDAEDDILIADTTITGGPFYGTLLEFNPNGTYTYKPDENFNGNDFFEYTISDGLLFSSTSDTVYLTIAPINDAPVFILEEVSIGIEEGEGTYFERPEWASEISDGETDQEPNQELEFLLYPDNPELFEVLPMIDSETGLLTFTIKDTIGTSNIEVILKDDGEENNGNVNESSPMTFTIVIDDLNNSPTFTAGSNIGYGSENLIFEDQEGQISIPWAENMDDGESSPEDPQTLTFNITSSTEDSAKFSSFPQIDSADGTLTFEIAENQNGLAELTVILSDNGFGFGPHDSTSIPEIFNIYITPINDNPSFIIGDDIGYGSTEDFIFEDGEEVIVESWATSISPGPIDENFQNLSFIITADPDAFQNFPVIDIVNLGGDQKEGKLSFQIADNWNGEVEVSVSLKDDGEMEFADDDDESDIQTFNISVQAINDEPVFELTNSLNEAISSLTVYEDSGTHTVYMTPGFIPTNEVDQDVVYSFSEPEEVSTFEAINILSDDFSIPFADLSINSNDSYTIIEIILKENAHGENQFTIYANDDGGIENGGDNSYEKSFTLKVEALNDPPQMDTLPVISVVDGGEALVGSLLSVTEGLWNDDLDDNFSVATSEITYTYQWQRADNNNFPFENLANIYAAQSSEYEVTQSDSHKYLRVVVTAYDNGGQGGGNSQPITENSDFFEISNTSPIAINDSYEMNEDEILSINFTEGLLKGWTYGDICADDCGGYCSDCDRDGDSLFVNIVNPGEPVSFGGIEIIEDGSFIYTPGVNENGTAVFSYYIEDESGNVSNTAVVEITVRPVNDEPIFEFSELEGGEPTETLAIYEDSGIQTLYMVPGLIPSNESGQVVEYSFSNSEVISNYQTINELNDVLYDHADLEIISNDIYTIVKITLEENAHGEAQFTIYAHDGGGQENGGDAWYEKSFLLDITKVNDEPSFEFFNDENGEPINSITVYEDPIRTDTTLVKNISSGQNLENVDIENEKNQDLFFAVVASSNDSLLSLIDCNPSFSGSTNREFIPQYICIDSNGNLQYTPLENANGSAELTIRLFDSDGTANGGIDSTIETKSFIINVLPVNDPPTFILGNSGLLEINEDGFENGGVLTKSVTAWISDIEPGPKDESGDTLTFNITSSKIDSNIFSEFPNIDEISGDISYAINPEFNGKAQFTINLSDDGGVENGGDSVSVDKTFSVWVHQINDAPLPFSVYPKIFEYNTQFSDSIKQVWNIESNPDSADYNPYPTFYSPENNFNNNLYFRLPYQVFAPEEQPPELLKFSWERNDALDIDTDITKNFDVLYQLYYRLEAIPNDGSKIFILADYIVTETDKDSISIEIDMTAEHSVYSGDFDSDSLYNMEYLDTTGVTEYSWRVIAQNYTEDYKGNDPVEIISSNVDLKLDLELPSAEMVFFQSELYSEYYDLYFLTNEETIDDIAHVWIEFEDYTQNLEPAKMGDSLYHISSTFVDTGIVKYNFQVRDKRLNLGRSLDTVSYNILIPELTRRVYSPDNILAMFVPENAVEYETPVIISIIDSDEGLSKNSVEILSREYQIAANSMVLLKPAKLSFRFKENLFDQPYYKYFIVRIENGDLEVLDTQFEGEVIVTSIMEPGNYAVIYDSEALEPLPEKFSLGDIYPNPFNPSTTIEFDIPYEDFVKIDVYNIRGQHVLNLLDEIINPGYHTVDWVGLDKVGQVVPSGIYFVNIKFTNQLMSKKVTFLK